MGTNYYVKKPQPNPCDKCGHQQEVEAIHIGKQSMGWKFIFNKKFPTYKDWMMHFFVGGWNYIENNQVRYHYAKDHIYDEYGEHITFEKLKEIIESHQGGMWTDDPRNPRYEVEANKNYEYLDDQGYRFSTAEEFC